MPPRVQSTGRSRAGSLAAGLEHLLRRARRYPALVAVVSGVLVPGCGGDRDLPPELPSIVLITIDTLRADRLGCYGYFRETSPFLDGLATQATRFENAYAPMATTLPSHVSLLTSTRPGRHGIKANVDVLSYRVTDVKGLRSFAQILSDLGYETAAFVSCSPLKRVSGVSVGFDHFSEPVGVERRAEETVDEVLEWLEGAGDRIFLWVHVFDPHNAYDPPAPYRAAFSSDAEQEAYLEACGIARPKQRGAQSNLYDGEILYADAQLARLGAALRESGRFDPAAIVVAGDHGESLGEHGWVGHGKIFRETLRVPLIVKLPGADPADARVERKVVGLIDVVPLVVEELGIPVAPADLRQLQGINPLRASRDHVLAEKVDGRESKVGRDKRWALIGDRWSLYGNADGGDALFDLWNDPYETRDVLGERPSVAREMSRELVRRIRAVDPLPANEAETGAPPEHLEELRALGYVE